MIDDEVRNKTLARFEAHRRVWRESEPLRALYARWYGLVKKALPDRSLGPWI